MKKNGGNTHLWKMCLYFSVFFILLSILFSGCTQQTQSPDLTEKAKNECITLCEMAKTGGTDLSKGPCLSNAIIEDWVCDIAHNPRQAVDNDSANQCSEFGHASHHFIELDPNCNFIKRY